MNPAFRTQIIRDGVRPSKIKCNGRKFYRGNKERFGASGEAERSGCETALQRTSKQPVLSPAPGYDMIFI